MKIKELIKVLKTLNQNADIKISSDEELNIIYSKFQIGELSDEELNTIYSKFQVGELKADK